jgi:hypothetical protein
MTLRVKFSAAFTFLGVFVFCTFGSAPMAAGPLPLPEEGRAFPPPQLSAITTGTHWGRVADMSTFRRMGYSFDVVTVNPGQKSQWKRVLDAAKANGLKLIIGAYPEPYSYVKGQWKVSQAGRKFLKYLKTRSSLVLALFVYNEPYWVSPFTGHTNSCGATSAEQLRRLRTKIRSFWQGAKIYHDLGWPSAWAPGGSLHASYPCIGRKYADQRGVADYAGIWDYPFTSLGFRKVEGLATLKREAKYVKSGMHATPVFLGQAHAVDNLVWPTSSELQDWNCAIRAALPAGSFLSWYVWRQEIYSDYLANHPEMQPMTTQAACH